MDHRLTNPQLQTASTCLRRHQWAYIAGIRPDAEAVALHFSAAWNRCLTRRAQGLAIAANIAVLRSEYDLGRPEFAAERAYDCEALAVLLTLYDRRWAAMDASLVPVAAEPSSEVPLTNPETGRSSRTFVFVGRMDRLYRLADGRLAVVERRAIGEDISHDASCWRRLGMDTQIVRDVLAARHLGHPVTTVLYDVVKKPQQRPIGVPLTDTEGIRIVLDGDGTRVRTKDGKKWRESGDHTAGYVLQTRPETPVEYAARIHAAVAADPAAYFARREIPRSQAELAESAQDLWDQAQVLHHCDREGRWPRNSSACIGFGTCPYLELCSANRTPADDRVPAGFVRVADPHHELIA